MCAQRRSDHPVHMRRAAGRANGLYFFGLQKGSRVDKQFCMYVETFPRSQTILYVRLDDFLGRAAASALPEARAPAAPK